MAVTVDEKTQNLLNRIRNGEEVSQFTEIEKSNMVFAWKSHVFSEVLPPWVLGITLFLFLVLAGGLGFLLTIVLCAVFFFGFAFAGD